MIHNIILKILILTLSFNILNFVDAWRIATYNNVDTVTDETTCVYVYKIHDGEIYRCAYVGYSNECSNRLKSHERNIKKYASVYNLYPGINSLSTTSPVGYFEHDACIIKHHIGRNDFPILIDVFELIDDGYNIKHWESLLIGELSPLCNREWKLKEQGKVLKGISKTYEEYKAMGVVGFERQALDEEADLYWDSFKPLVEDLWSTGPKTRGFTQMVQEHNEMITNSISSSTSATTSSSASSQTSQGIMTHRERKSKTTATHLSPQTSPVVASINNVQNPNHDPLVYHPTSKAHWYNQAVFIFKDVK